MARDPLTLHRPAMRSRCGGFALKQAAQTSAAVSSFLIFSFVFNWLQDEVHKLITQWQKVWLWLHGQLLILFLHFLILTLIDTFSFYHSHLIFYPLAKNFLTLSSFCVISGPAASSPSSCFSVTSDSSLPSHFPLLIISSSSSLFQSDETSQPSIREPFNLPVFPSSSFSSSTLCLFSLPWKLFHPLCVPAVTHPRVSCAASVLAPRLNLLALVQK